MQSSLLSWPRVLSPFRLRRSERQLTLRKWVALRRELTLLAPVIMRFALPVVLHVAKVGRVAAFIGGLEGRDVLFTATFLLVLAAADEDDVLDSPSFQEPNRVSQQ